MDNRRRRSDRPVEKKEFIERVIEINRVTRVVKGGKRMRFRALVAIGDGKGRIGYGVSKAADVAGAISKAVAAAKKRITHAVFKNSSIPYPVRFSYKSAHILLKPAPAGTGIIAGGSMRTVLQLAGVKDVVGKALGSQNKMSNTVATIQALSQIIDPQELLMMRGRSATTAKAKTSPAAKAKAKPKS